MAPLSPPLDTFLLSIGDFGAAGPLPSGDFYLNIELWLFMSKVAPCPPRAELNIDSPPPRLALAGTWFTGMLV